MFRCSREKRCQDYLEVGEKKNSAAALFFSTHFSVFGYLMKHSSSCLIYYLKQNKTIGYCPILFEQSKRTLTLALALFKETVPLD